MSNNKVLKTRHLAPGAPSRIRAKNRFVNTKQDIFVTQNTAKFLTHVIVKGVVYIPH